MMPGNRTFLQCHNTLIQQEPGFTVFDIDTDNFIQPLNGWFKIPAGHSVTITKQVTTPQLVNYSEDISDLASATYIPRLNDHSITWSVNREIDIAVIHDAGESNIPAMSQHFNPAGTGIMSYQISR
jgi:hypothetical protein